MKNRTKARGLRARGILKKATVFGPLALTLAGTAGLLGFLIGGSNIKEDALNDFKNSAIYDTAYSQEYTETEEAFKNGEISVYKFNEKINHMEEDSYVEEVLARTGEEGDEYRAMIKHGEDIRLGHIGGGVGFLAGVALMVVVGVATDFAENMWESADDDFYKAREIIDKDREEKEEKKDKELMGTNENEEEVLPNISESYYSE